MNRRGIRTTLLALIALLAIGLVAQAQEQNQDQAQQDAAASATLQLSSAGGFGEHIVTGEGRSVYVYTQDAEGQIACTDRCAENWPPLLAEGEATVGEGLDASLLGTVERPDGGTQLTYAGQPLYLYARDEGEGDVRGQALGGQFFLLTGAGEQVTAAVEQFEAAEVSEEELAALQEEGGPLYANNCAACHGVEGQGGIGPALANNARLQDTEFYVGRILNGFPEHGMPPFRGQLDDRQVAAIATFTRTTWGNDYGAVSEEQVAEQR